MVYASFSENKIHHWNCQYPGANDISIYINIFRNQFLYAQARENATVKEAMPWPKDMFVHKLVMSRNFIELAAKVCNKLM